MSLSLWLTVWLSVFERVWCGGEVCDTTVFLFFVCFVGLEHWCVCVCVLSTGRQVVGLLRYPFFSFVCSWPRVGIEMDRCRVAPLPRRLDLILVRWCCLWLVCETVACCCYMYIEGLASG